MQRNDRILSYTVLTAFSVFALYPLVGIVLLGLNERDALVTGLSLPAQPTLETLATAWTDGNFGPAIRSSLIITAIVLGASILLSILAGYAFALMRFRGSSLIFYFILFGVVVPYEATIYPLYYNFRSLGLANTYWAVILPEVGLSVAFGTLWMRAFFRSAPHELMDAARMDGASGWTILWSILVPLARPAVVTLAILLFVYNWNEFLLPLVMLQDTTNWTAPVALSFFAGERHFADRTLVASAALLVALPVLVVYVLLQRFVVQGIMGGAIKE